MPSASDLISAGFLTSLEISLKSPSQPTDSRPPAYRAVGLTLAICSGLFIGTSFVLKKVGLLKANVKYNEEAGEGYGYLKNAYWWTGMTLMIVGEICNFVAYAFVDAILVTPLGALSVVVTTILSAIFLKERLSFVGKIGCFICIVGSIVIVLNAPAQSSAADIQTMQSFVIAPGFLSYAGVVIIGCAVVAFYVGPRYGKKSMLVYLTICSLIGGLSVVATQGLGAAVVAQAGGKPQFNQWFLYVLLVFVVATLLTEIIYLNKALNLFNAALVTPTYYVYFTSSTIVASAILFRGFKGTPLSIATIIMGFLQICAGVVLLQLSKSAKDVPDTAVLKGDLDQIRTVGEQEQPESEPKADAIRGAAALIRRISTSRQKMEEDEARRVYAEKLRDQMEPIKENEVVEWDGLRRRKTVLEPGTPIQRRKTLHPGLGLTKFPDYNENAVENNINTNDQNSREASRERGNTGPSDHSEGSGFLGSFRRRRTSSSRISVNPVMFTPRPPTATPVPEADENIVGGVDGHGEDGVEMKHVYGMPSGLRALGSSANSSRVSPGEERREIKWAADVDDHESHKKQQQQPPQPPPHRPGLLSPGGSSSQPGTPGSNRRQFSFQNVFHRHHRDDTSGGSSGGGGGGSSGGADASKSSASSSSHSRQTSQSKRNFPDVTVVTEEERLGLVKGDSNQPASGGALGSASSSDGEANLPPVKPRSSSEIQLPSIGAMRFAQQQQQHGQYGQYDGPRQRFGGSSPELRSPTTRSRGAAAAGAEQQQQQQQREQSYESIPLRRGSDGSDSDPDAGDKSLEGLPPRGDSLGGGGKGHGRSGSAGGGGGTRGGGGAGGGAFI